MTSKTKQPEMSIIAGCFYGLSHLLTNFTHSVQEGIFGVFHKFNFVWHYEWSYI